MPLTLPFILDQKYVRKDIHDTFRGNRQSGISSSKSQPLIFLFTGGRGKESGYEDGWYSENEFRYSGEGRTGKMKLTSMGNKALLNHRKDGKAVHLFAYDGKSSSVVYKGEFSYAGHIFVDGVLDKDGNPRRAIVFQLSPLDNYVPLTEEVTSDEVHVEGAVRKILVNAFERNGAARAACIRHFGSTCAACGFDFGTVYGDSAKGYIHVHHTRPLAEIRTEYAVDPLKDLIPLCPNCHAFVHRTAPAMTIAELRTILCR